MKKIDLNASQTQNTTRKKLKPDNKGPGDEQYGSNLDDLDETVDADTVGENDSDERIYDDEIATVKRIPEQIYEKIPGATLLQKLTTVTFMMICLLTCMLSIRILKHVKTMRDYEIPENVVISETDTQVPETEEIEYIEQVTYSPTEAAKLELANANGGKNWSPSLSCPYTWSFKSDYTYDSAKIQCVWLCTHDDTGEILAIRVGTYNGGTNDFSDVTIYNTVAGVKYVAAD